MHSDWFKLVTCIAISNHSFLPQRRAISQLCNFYLTLAPGFESLHEGVSWLLC